MSSTVGSASSAHAEQHDAQAAALDPADVRTLGRLFAELQIADVLQPIACAAQPQLLRPLSEEICAYLDTLRVRPASCCCMG